eukprot:2616131-Amphidinium_carterae.1
MVVGGACGASSPLGKSGIACPSIAPQALAGVGGDRRAAGGIAFAFAALFGRAAGFGTGATTLLITILPIGFEVYSLPGGGGAGTGACVAEAVIAVASHSRSS